MIWNKIFTFICNKTTGLRYFIDNVILYQIFKLFNNYRIINKFKGKDILIVGNGPSLNKTKLDNISMVSIGMNKINLLFDKTNWRPDIITCSNGLVLKQNKKFFNKTDIVLILPIRALYLGIKKRKNIIFIANSKKIRFGNNSIKTKFPYGGATITYQALHLASTLSPKTINIVGVDHYFKSYKGTKGIVKYEGNDIDHFDPNYFKNQAWGLPDLEGSEIAYNIAKNYFENNNIRCTDYTVNGKLRVFEKGNIEDIYN